MRGHAPRGVVLGEKGVVEGNLQVQGSLQEWLWEACEGSLSTYCVLGSGAIPGALVPILGEVRHVPAMPGCCGPRGIVPGGSES